MKTKIAAWLLLACAASCGANSNNPGPTGGKTNWLAECVRDAECSDLTNSVCEDSRCTKLCSSDRDCRELGDDATCVSPEGFCTVGRESPELPEGDPITSESDEASSADAGTSDASAVVAEDTDPAPEVASAPGAETASGGEATMLSGSLTSSADDPVSGTTPMDAGASDELGATQMNGSDDAGSDGMMELPESGACEPNTIDPNQGNPAPAEEDCAQIGQAAKQAYESALARVTLEVEPLAGTWIDAAGEPRIELVLDAAGAGSLRFGDASVYPEPSASDETFLTATAERDGNDIVGGAHLHPQPGFAYTVVSTAGAGSEMSFHILTVEAWDPWCALQAPVYSPYAPGCHACTDVAEIYSFFPSSCGDEAGCFASDRDPSEVKRVPCGRVELCAMPYSSVCTCNAEECFANVAMQGQLNWYPYELELDPVDTTLLRLRSLSELSDKTTRYLQKQAVVAD